MNIKYKILIVEDNPSDIELAQREIRQVLKSVEFSGLCTREAFLDSLKTFKPDIIISDYSMPAFDGLSVIRLTRKEAPLVPVVIFTGSLNEETAAETVKAGATDYVLKENNLRLRQAVLNALEIKQMWIEQRESQEKLRLSEERYRILFEQAADGIFQGDKDGNFIGVNASGAQITGYSLNELSKMNMRDLFTEEERKREPLKYELLKKGQVVRRERTITRKDGTTCEIEMNTKMLPDKTYMAVIRDITQRKKTERELKESEERLSNLINTIPVGVVIHSDEKLVFGNKAAFNIMESEPTTSYVGANILDFIDPASKDIIIERLRNTIKNGKIDPIVAGFKTAAGKIITVELNSIPLMYKGVPSILTVFNDISKRMQAEKELRDSEERYSNLIKMLPVGIAIHQQGKIVFANETAEQFFDVAPDKTIVGSKIFDFLHPDYLETVKQRIKKSLDKNTKAEPNEEVFITFTGKEFPVEVTSIPIEFKGAKALLTVFNDISARKKAQKLLIDSEAKYRSFFENTGTATAIVEEDATISLCNTQFVELVGIAKEELENKRKWTEFVVPEDLDMMMNMHTLRRQDPLKALREYEFNFKDAKGNIKNIMLYVDIIPGTNKSLASLLNITKLKQTEQRLKEANHQLELVFNNGPDAILLTKIENGFYIDSNKTFTKYTGYTPDDLRGKSTLDIDIWNDPKDRDTLLHEVQSKGYCHNLELVVKNKNGTFRTIEMSAEVIVIKGVPCLLSISRDIAERKRMEDLLQKQNNELKDLVATKDKFFSIIAHDLKDPHNAILGFSEILSGSYDMLSEQDRKNYINNILLSSQALSRLLQNLLEWAGSQTGKMVYKPEELDLGKLIRETIDLLHYQAKIKQIRLVSDIDSSAKVYADLNMTKTVLRNLVSNAIKFTRRNGFVKISTLDVPDENSNNSFVEISVADNGIGIKKENLPNLFRLDSKIKTQGTEEETGSGLGLILCKELIEKNKGSLSINSEENVGTTVSFTLPLKAIK